MLVPAVKPIKYTTVIFAIASTAIAVMQLYLSNEVRVLGDVVQKQHSDIEELHASVKRIEDTMAKESNYNLASDPVTLARAQGESAQPPVVKASYQINNGNHCIHYSTGGSSGCGLKAPKQ